MLLSVLRSICLAVCESAFFFFSRTVAQSTSSTTCPNILSSYCIINGIGIIKPSGLLISNIILKHWSHKYKKFPPFICITIHLHIFTSCVKTEGPTRSHVCTTCKTRLRKGSLNGTSLTSSGYNNDIHAELHCRRRAPTGEARHKSVISCEKMPCGSLQCRFFVRESPLCRSCLRFLLRSVGTFSHECLCLKFRYAF